MGTSLGNAGEPECSPFPPLEEGTGNAPRERSRMPQRGSVRPDWQTPLGRGLASHPPVSESAVSQPHVSLREALARLPGDALVPVAWIRERLGAKPSEVARDRLLTVAEVAAHCARATSTVRAWCASGELPDAFKLNGVAWRVPESAVRKFLADQRKSSRSAGRALGRVRPIDPGEWRKARDA
jgi:predicted DNA-binding transcriptional regulator AlpA